MLRSTSGIDPGPLAQVTEGMTVLDSTGQDLGTIADVTFGDPDAVGGQDQQVPGSSAVLLADLTSVFTGGLPAAGQHRQRLLRTGYLRVRAPGRWTGDLYVSAKHVSAVTGSCVRLDVPGTGLTVA